MITTWQISKLDEGEVSPFETIQEYDPIIIIILLRPPCFSTNFAYR